MRLGDAWRIKLELFHTWWLIYKLLVKNMISSYRPDVATAVTIAWSMQPMGNTLGTPKTHSEHTERTLWENPKHTEEQPGSTRRALGNSESENAWRTHWENTQNTLWEHPKHTYNTLKALGNSESEHTWRTHWQRPPRSQRAFIFGAYLRPRMTGLASIEAL